MVVLRWGLLSTFKGLSIGVTQTENTVSWFPVSRVLSLLTRLKFHKSMFIFKILTGKMLLDFLVSFSHHDKRVSCSISPYRALNYSRPARNILSVFSGTTSPHISKERTSVCTRSSCYKGTCSFKGVGKVIQRWGETVADYELKSLTLDSTTIKRWF